VPLRSNTIGGPGNSLKHACRPVPSEVDLGTHSQTRALGQHDLAPVESMAAQTVRIREIVRDEPARANDTVCVTTGPRLNGSLPYTSSSWDSRWTRSQPSRKLGASWKVTAGRMAMEKVSRLCPVCGTANPLEAANCRECGSDVERDLPTVRESKLPVPWREVGAGLAVGATALALRAGVQLVRGLLQGRGRRTLSLSKGPSTLRELKKRLPLRGREEQAATSQPQIRMWGRRAWGVWRSDGASQWEVEEIQWEGTERAR
jgi:ribosomal protein L40E